MQQSLPPACRKKLEILGDVVTCTETVTQLHDPFRTHYPFLTRLIDSCSVHDLKVVNEYGTTDYRLYRRHTDSGSVQWWLVRAPRFFESIIGDESVVPGREFFLHFGGFVIDEEGVPNSLVSCGSSISNSFGKSLSSEDWHLWKSTLLDYGYDQDDLWQLDELRHLSTLPSGDELMFRESDGFAYCLSRSDGVELTDLGLHATPVMNPVLFKLRPPLPDLIEEFAVRTMG